MKKLLALIFLILAAPIVSASCRYLAEDARGFPLGVQPSVSNLSIQALKGGTVNESFELVIAGDQSQGLHFKCSVSLSALSSSPEVSLSLAPEIFRTGGGFNKTKVIVYVRASDNATDAMAWKDV